MPFGPQATVTLKTRLSTRNLSLTRLDSAVRPEGNTNQLGEVGIAALL